MDALGFGGQEGRKPALYLYYGDKRKGLKTAKSKHDRPVKRPLPNERKKWERKDGNGSCTAVPLHRSGSCEGGRASKREKRENPLSSCSNVIRICSLF